MQNLQTSDEVILQLSSDEDEYVNIQNLSGLPQYYGPLSQGNIAQDFNMSTTITINSQSGTLSDSDNKEGGEEEEKESEEYENEIPDETIKCLKAACDSRSRPSKVQKLQVGVKIKQMPETV